MNYVTEFKYDDVSVRLDSLKAGVTFMHDWDYWMLTTKDNGWEKINKEHLIVRLRDGDHIELPAEYRVYPASIVLKTEI